MIKTYLNVKTNERTNTTEKKEREKENDSTLSSFSVHALHANKHKMIHTHTLIGAQPIEVDEQQSKRRVSWRNCSLAVFRRNCVQIQRSIKIVIYIQMSERV